MNINVNAMADRIMAENDILRRAWSCLQATLNDYGIDISNKPFALGQPLVHNLLCRLADQKVIGKNNYRFERHYDYTDCPWYIPGAQSRCPEQCKQYRDGWNDAMEYIYGDGPGYQPYKRESKEP